MTKDKIIELIALLVALSVPLSAESATNYPSWWTSRSVITNSAVNDHAPVNAGQLKWVAAKAFDELQANLPGGAGTGVASLVSAFSTSNNYVPVNLGQLKYVAKPFYDQLIFRGYADAFPWTTNTTGDDADFAPANLGQLKNVFSFDLAYDPGNPSNISGLVFYYGGQTGLIHVSATSFDANMQSLIMDYRFTTGGSSVADESGHGHTGQVFGATYTTTGHLGGAYNFDGTNDYIRVYSLGTMSSGTISMWVYANASVVSGSGPLKSDMDNTTEYCFYFERLSSGRFRAVHWKYGLTNLVFTTNAFTVSTWHHILFMWNQTNVSGYLNGQLSFSQPNNGLNTDFTRLALGFSRDNQSPSYFWRGMIDEVQMYNRALSPQQVSNLYLTGFIGAPSSRYETTITGPGPYVIANLTNLQTYNISAYRDHNGNQTNDLWEAWGNSSANPIFLSNRFTNANITLVDPDADSDTMPDWWEMAHGLSYTNSSDALGDPDADGLVNRDEYATGGDPNTTDYTVFSIPYSTGFESMEGYSPGALADQRGWSCFSSGVQVQTGWVAEGSQATHAAEDVWMKHRFYTAAGILTNECSLYLSDASAFGQSPSNMPALASSVLSYDPTQGIMALDGNGSGGGNWVLVDDAAPRQWVAVKIVQNYGTKRWDVSVNGVLKNSGLGFKDNGVSSLGALQVENGSVGEIFIDKIALKAGN